MKLIVTKDLKNNNYNVELKFIDVTETDKERISDFGEISIDIGGVVKDTFGSPVTRVKQKKKTETYNKAVPVFEADGVTPVYEEDGVTQKVNIVEDTRDVLDGMGRPVYEDVLDDMNRPVYETVNVATGETLVNLGENIRKFPSGFPVIVTFKTEDHNDNTQKIAESYVNTVREEIQSKIDAFNEKADTFSGSLEFDLNNPPVAEE